MPTHGLQRSIGGAFLCLLTLTGCGFGTPGRPFGRQRVIAFWASGKHQSLSALRASPEVVTAIAPFIESVEPDGSVKTKSTGTVLSTARKLGIPVTPLFNSPVSETFLSDAKLRSRAVSAIANVMKAGHYKGLHLDFEPPHTRYASDLVTFVAALHSTLPRSSIYLDIVPSSGGAYDYTRLTPLLAGYALMSYDQHSDGSAPGPVAATPWVQAMTAALLKKIPASHLILGLATYGYAWPKGSTHAKTLPLRSLPAPAVKAAHFDKASQEMTATYTLGGTTYTAWWETMTGIRTKVQMAKKDGLGGVTVWRLGYDTPTLWKTIARA